MDRKTKIVCTIGPKTRTKDHLQQLVEAGMNAVRLNFSYGTHKWHKKAINMVRDLNDANIGIIQDLQGPRIRIGDISPRTLVAGEHITISQDSIPLTPPEIIKDPTVGEKILLKDGSIELQIEAIEGDFLKCQVIEGGEITSHTNVFFPESELSIKSLTEKDKEDLRWGLDQGVDYIGLSFVRDGTDIKEAQRIIDQHSTRAHLIAKIETRQAIANLDQIVQVSDGIMVARGDLGVQYPIFQVPRLQRQIITKANQYGKPVIVATQMLASMVDSPTPTRAEIQDISSAVLSGADAVMLSEESAIGKHPVEAVKVMAEASKETEPDFPHDQWMQKKRIQQDSIYEAIAFSACRIASTLPETSAIVTETSSGATAKRVSKFRPREKILAFTPHKKTARLLSIVWGVFPTLMEKTDSINKMIEKTENVLKQQEHLKKGDLTVLTAGFPFGIGKKTNLIKVHRIT